MWAAFSGRKINCSKDIPNPRRTCFSELNVAQYGLQMLHSSAHASEIVWHNMVCRCCIPLLMPVKLSGTIWFADAAFLCSCE